MSRPFWGRTTSMRWNCILCACCVFFLGALGSVSMSVSLLVSPLTVAICRRKSTRLTAVLGGLITSLAFLFTSFASQFHQVFFSYGIFFGKKHAWRRMKMCVQFMGGNSTLKFSCTRVSWRDARPRSVRFLSNFRHWRGNESRCSCTHDRSILQAKAWIGGNGFLFGKWNRNGHHGTFPAHLRQVSWSVTRLFVLVQLRWERFDYKESNLHMPVPMIQSWPRWSDWKWKS